MKMVCPYADKCDDTECEHYRTPHKQTGSCQFSCDKDRKIDRSDRFCYPTLDFDKWKKKIEKQQEITGLEQCDEKCIYGKPPIMPFGDTFICKHPEAIDRRVWLCEWDGNFPTYCPLLE